MNILELAKDMLKFIVLGTIYTPTNTECKETK